jgi:EAL domain-containing protein (putative c-di-GMP-specific phosphodiesterase class I)
VSQRRLRGWSVLLVDDRVEERDLLAAALADSGFEVIGAESGPAALRVLQDRTVQLVLVEARLLGTTAPDLIRSLHRHGPDLHVIVLTAGGEEPRVLDQIRRADDHIRRPFTTQRLIAHLVDVLRRRVTGGNREGGPGRDGSRATGEERLTADIARGLAAREFEVFYQPIVCLKDRSTIGFESLVRWRHPDRGLLAPSAFIATAERSGLIVELGEHVLETACQQAERWLGAGLDLHVAVNLSARQLVDVGLADRIGALMTTASLPPGTLWLEVTETALIEDIRLAKATLERIEALGAWLSIDDFGTGWASLTYLRQFPSHALKIDLSFVSGLGANASDEAIVRSILLLGTELDLAVIAEGVETELQVARLLDLGCDLAQGYLFGRPLPVAELSLPS